MTITSKFSISAYVLYYSFNLPMLHGVSVPSAKILAFASCFVVTEFFLSV